MSKSGQTATKADTGGQRVPKSGSDSAGHDKKAAPKAVTPKKDAGKKSAP